MSQNQMPTTICIFVSLFTHDKFSDLNDDDDDDDDDDNNN